MGSRSRRSASRCALEAGRSSERLSLATAAVTSHSGVGPRTVRSASPRLKDACGAASRPAAPVLDPRAPGRPRSGLRAGPSAPPWMARGPPPHSLLSGRAPLRADSLDGQSMFALADEQLFYRRDDVTQPVLFGLSSGARRATRSFRAACRFCRVRAVPRVPARGIGPLSLRPRRRHSDRRLSGDPCAMRGECNGMPVAAGSRGNLRTGTGGVGRGFQSQSVSADG